MTNSKSRILSPSAVMLVLILASLSSGPALAVEQGPLAMEILVGGTPLEEIAARGTTYVEALRGREYAVRLTNRSGGRVAVALSVDGLNSIDAKTSSPGKAAKWILGPYESTTIDGWQISNSSARRVFSTTETKSYGAWLGKTRNLGLISTVVFRERLPEPITIYQDNRAPSAGPQEREEAGARSKAGADLSDDHAGTGIGPQIRHQVRRVLFEAESSPAAILEIRYEFRDSLVRLGVLPETCLETPLDRRESARGFVDYGYAPDPYRR
jgi:hypothetical protein